jgi:hypothetical protein
MTEDSGAFKTNSRNPAQFGHFAISPPLRGNGASPAQETTFGGVFRASTPPICSKRCEAVALFLNQPDSRAPAVSAPSRWRPVLWSPRSQWLKDLRSTNAEAELASMLPGLRFLFAAIVLSMSVLVFGLGAAALLRAAHEQFVSVPSWRPPPETIFAQPNPNNEAAKPVLAMLRVDPPVEEPKAPDNQASEDTPAAAPTEPEVIVTAPTEPERIAALRPDESTPPATATPEFTVAETPAPNETTPAAADAPAPADEIKIAATQESLPAINEAAPAAPEQTSAPASPGADLAMTKIATLSGPPVTIEPPATVSRATSDLSVIKKRLQARRAKERRRLALRARLARQVHAQPVDDPFALPAATIRSR